MPASSALPEASPPESSPLSRTRELAMSAAWHGGLLRALTTTDGEAVQVTYGGNWSHGFGPDFADAMLVINGESRTGAVEIHRDSRDWYRHGHDHDPAYKSVILHVVAVNTMEETRTDSGNTVPTVVLNVPDSALFRIDQQLPQIWDELGQTTCAEGLAIHAPGVIRAALNRLGDQRFSERVTRYEGDLTVEPLSGLMLRGLADALGYSQNREPMGLVADALLEAAIPERIAIEPVSSRMTLSRAMVFGVGGFLPFSPSDAHLAAITPDVITEIEHRWLAECGAMHGHTIPATAWQRARTRPANHPAARLGTLATMLANARGDLAAPFVEAVRDGVAVQDRMVALATYGVQPTLGLPRAIAAVASVILPLVMAHAHHLDDNDLEDQLARAWAELPRSEWSRTSKRAAQQAAGNAPLGAITERTIQGLIHLDRALCTPRQCHACPIAAEVVRDRLTTSLPVSEA